MNEPITVGAAAIVAALTVGSLGTRWYVRPPGEHRKPRVRKVLDEQSLDELLGPWPEPVYGAALVQAWRPCSGPCGGEMPSVLHRGGWTCGHCLTSTTAGAR